MSAEPMLFTPEVEEVLREVAADPRSSLLKISRPEHLRGHFERYSNVGPQTAGLTAAERHLVTAYRSEVARLLGDVCRRRLVDASPTISCSVTVDTQVKIYEEHELRERAKEIRDLGTEWTEPGIEELLASCVSGAISREPTVTDLATAMARLEPSDSARVLAGLDLNLRGSPRVALQLYRSALEGQPDALMESQIWDNVGQSLAVLGEDESALRASRSASTVNPSKVTSRFVWCQAALVLGIHEDAEDAALQINDLVGPNDEAVNWYLLMLKHRRASGEWVPTNTGLGTMRRLGDRYGGAVGRLADVWI
jgi:hypothetical protein